jgi:hypothetical protein
LIPLFIKQLKNNEQVTIQGDGTAIRSFLHVVDVCKAFEIILEKGVVGEIYNIGTHIEYSVLQIAKILIKLIKHTDSFDNYIYIIRIQLSQYLINNNGFNIFFTNKRITIDGSKIGAFPSLIHETNHLVYNSEYMQLYSYLLKDKNEINKDFVQISKIHKSVECIKNSDIELLYSKILLKIGNIENAKNTLLLALTYAKTNNALLNNRCEIINMLIDISGKTQNDLEKLINNTSKYTNCSLLE